MKRISFKYESTFFNSRGRTGFACVLLLIAFGCQTSPETTTAAAVPDTVATADTLTDAALLDSIQYRTFQYFWEGAEPTSGLARERIHLDGHYPEQDQDVITIGGSGFGLMVILVGIERGFISRREGVARLEMAVDFLARADRFHGVWPHWLLPSGKTKPFSAKDDGADLVETSFLAKGLLTVRQYLDSTDVRERSLQRQINQLWQTIEWDWHTRGGQPVLYWHWSPQHAWDMNLAIRGYDECLITYVLAVSSPTHGIDTAAYHQGWARGGDIGQPTTGYGLSLPLAHNGALVGGGPLFWAHYSYLGLRPEGLRDRYADYGQHNVGHAQMNYRHCVENPHNFEGYGPDCWGLTASYSVKGYAGHAPGRDLGVIAPTAALASMPYTPEESLRAARFFYTQLGDRLWGKYGFYDAFSQEADWFPPHYLAIDQGPIVVMIENHRSGLLWDLFMSAPEVRAGLQRLGFTQPTN